MELIGHLGRVQTHGGDEFTFTVGTRHESFKRPHSAEFGVEEVSGFADFSKRQALSPRRCSTHNRCA